MVEEEEDEEEVLPWLLSSETEMKVRGSLLVWKMTKKGRIGYEQVAIVMSVSMSHVKIV